MHTTAHIVDRPEWLPEHPRGNPRPALTDDTRLRVTSGDETFDTTAGAFFGDNDDDAFDRGAVLAALQRGEVWRGGGGAEAEWSVERVL